MKQMQTQMQKIRNTTDPKERQKLMQEHTQPMREHMEMWHDTGGCIMMVPMARGERPNAGRAERSRGHGKMRDADPSRRQEMREQRRDQMQMMMDQMMQHQETTQANPNSRRLEATMVDSDTTVSVDTRGVDSRFQRKSLTEQSDAFPSQSEHPGRCH